MLTLKLLAHRLLAVLLLLLLQGPATVMQEVAWCRMIVTYSRENGFARGVVETFDGSRPCSLCRVAEKLRKTATPEQNRPEDSRLSWGHLLPSSRLRIVPPEPENTRHPWHLRTCAQYADRRDAPPVPPPRWL